MGGALTKSGLIAEAPVADLACLQQLTDRHHLAAAAAAAAAAARVAQ
jgi:hypothetical protein